MKEKKFKALTKDKREWIYGGYVTPELLITRDPFDGGFFYHAVFPQTVCQFINRYDKNHKEIYENDIIKIDDTNYGYGGEYDLTHDGTIDILVDKIEAFMNEDNDCEFYYFNNCEVVGNIYISSSDSIKK